MRMLFPFPVFTLLYFTFKISEPSSVILELGYLVVTLVTCVLMIWIFSRCVAVFIVIIMSDSDDEDFNLDYPISQVRVFLFKK